MNRLIRKASPNQGSLGAIASGTNQLGFPKVLGQISAQKVIKNRQNYGI